jgi:hypothetical protein
MEDKRRHPRFEVEGVQGMMHYSCPLNVLNMSLGGIAVQAPMRLNIGRDYSIKLEIAGQPAQLNTAVVWSVLSGMRKGPTGELVPFYSAGLKFKDALNERISELLGFVDDNKVQEESRIAGIRFRIDAPGKVALDVPQVYEVCLISLSGMLIKTEQNLVIEGTYPMEFCPPDQPPIRFSGRVASSLEVADEEPSYYEIGIEFTEITREDQARLSAFVAAAKQHA